MAPLGEVDLKYTLANQRPQMESVTEPSLMIKMTYDFKPIKMLIEVEYKNKQI